MHPPAYPRSLTAALLALAVSATAQVRLSSVEFAAARGADIVSLRVAEGQRIVLTRPLPLFSLEVDDTLRTASAGTARRPGDTLAFTLPPGISCELTSHSGAARGWKGTLTLRNVSGTRKKLANLVPLGAGPDRVYIDAASHPQTGPNRLARSRLWRPGAGPVGVVLPDNAWELGYCDIPVGTGLSLTAIARRQGATEADVRRFHTVLNPGGSVTYVVHADLHTGGWHEGLRMMFQERWLYDIEQFDDTLFRRPDLAWVRSSYTMLLQFAWDQTYHERFQHRTVFDSTIAAYDRILGGFDVFVVWPTWPRLGLDERNQFDLYRDLPGGLAELRRQVDVAHARGGKYFISYNPWDASTRTEDHLKGMADLLRSTDADGVVLDTRGESSREFQETADRVKPGIVMYSEGMAVPKDMPGIVAGRVHDAIFMPPPLNLNKFIRPDFAIFRVLQVTEGRIHREVAVAFFNGYGSEVNIMRPGRPDWIVQEFRTLGRTTKILRENSSNFQAADWTPLIATRADSIWVNRWPGAAKTIYTVYNLRPEGFDGPLFEAPRRADRHYVDLWHHAEVEPVAVDGVTSVPVRAEGFSRSSLGTREEGSVDCIAWLPRLLEVALLGDSLRVSASTGEKIIVWAGPPSYDTRHVTFRTEERTISLREQLGKHEEKFVVQLFQGNELMDERVVHVPLATPRLISRVDSTERSRTAPAGMVEIPGGRYDFQTSPTEVPNPVIPYPVYPQPWTLGMRKMFMDAYPVTNAQFKKFLDDAAYRPKDTVNFLRHWHRGQIPPGLDRHPVVWVSLEDARAYCAWAGKRLPTTVEWQYAAQGTDGRSYPWGSAFDSTRCNNALNHTTPVDSFPSGASPFGVMDMVGNVWQMTADVYDNISYYFGLLRGGSHYHPRSSEWYVTGGPWPVDRQQVLLLVSPGFDRSGTVGFRCVKDAE